MTSIPSVTLPLIAAIILNLKHAFVRDWIDAPEWTDHWPKPADRINRIAINPDQVHRQIQAMNADGSWPGIDYKHQSRENWDAIRHFTEGLHPLAVAYGSTESTLHQSELVRSALLRAMDFWLARDFQNPNWWYQQIGLPAYFLGPVALLLAEFLSPTQRVKTSEIISRCDLKRHDNWRTGGNCLFDCRAGLVYGLFDGNAELVTRIYSQMLCKELHLTPMEGSGIKQDMSHWEHGNLVFNHGYGALILIEGGRLMSLGRKVGISVDEATLKFLADYLLDGSQWMARGDFLDYAANGRGIAVPISSKGNGTTAAGSGSYLAVGARYLLDAGAPRAVELMAVIERAIDERELLTGNRHFYISDYTVHQRPHFYASVRNYSSRTINTEVCNSTNRLGHHLGEGSMYIVRRGDEYRDVFPVWDWNRVPGTTTNLSALEDAHGYIDENTDSGWFPSLAPEDEGFGKARLRVSRIGRSDFVGGVSDGRAGVSCLDLKVLSLRARKAWVFFDDGIFCIGSGITDSQPSPLITTVNQCRLVGEVHVIDASGTERQLDHGTHSLGAVRLVWHDETAYVFEPGQQVVCSNQTQFGNWWRINANHSDARVEMPIFSLWLEHGCFPDHGSYAYRIVPGISLEDARHLVGDATVEVLASTPDLHAVRHRSTGLIAAVFFRPGILRISTDLDVRVSHPCVMLLSEREKKIAIADPTQATRQINIGVRGTTFMHHAQVSGGRTTMLDWKF